MGDQKELDFKEKTEEQSFEAMIELLKANRVKLNQSNSFEETSQLWQEIKHLHAQCAKTVEDVSWQLTTLEGENFAANYIESLDIENLKFSEALKQLEDLTQKSKTISITQIPELIKQMQALKIFCFNKLNQEKLKMEEVE